MVKKGKKSKKETGPEIRTTQIIINERAKMLCPRMGDCYTRTMKVEEILEDAVIVILEKCVSKQQDHLCLSGMRLSVMPNIFEVNEDLLNLVDVNLSRNQLFNGNKVFQVSDSSFLLDLLSNCLSLCLFLTLCAQVLSQLTGLKKLNLSFNCLNGVLSDTLGTMLSLEVLHLDNNQITGFPTNTDGWTNLKTLTACENSIRGTPSPVLTSPIFSFTPTEIPAEAMSWVSLVYLNLRKNLIDQLPVLVVKSWTKVPHPLLTLHSMTLPVPIDRWSDCTSASIVFERSLTRSAIARDWSSWISLLIYWKEYLWGWRCVSTSTFSTLEQIKSSLSHRTSSLL
jgi:hypothetical protein